MKLEEAIRNRRSIRNFTEQPVDIELIKKIIEMGIYAPSACNIQGWRFVIITKQQIKDKIVDLGGSAQIKNAPVGILVLYDKRSKNTEYHDHIQSAAACVENMLLAACSYGLGACWICNLPLKNRLRNALNIPSVLDPVAYIIMGYPKSKPAPIERKYPLSKLISFNQFDSQETIKETEKLLLIKKILLKLYRLSPSWLNKLFLNKFIDKRFVKKFKN